MSTKFGRTTLIGFALIGLTFSIAIMLLGSFSCGPTAVYLQTGPPEATVEVRTVAPSPAAVWIDGEWIWNGSQYVWIAGRWEEHPRGRSWTPGRWDKHDKGWHHREGHWNK